ncbi:hypothetical protein [Naasia sp. SYSU D00057]|uniref:hypothetical protein n=1 Tax=Naasia sp. SYSU D00057 TaxID=2817380 RepID=UPI001B30EA1B|nr:hypothetical protein [Naasia sp. SYSU D00057]
MNGPLRRIGMAALALSMVALSGCAGAGQPPAGTASATSSPTSPAPTRSAPAEPLAPRDADALAQLADVAPRTSTIDPALADWTECWLPSDHLLPAEEVGNETTWAVICRIHWHEEDGTARYQDTNCTGDFAAQPMLDHCYRWVHYDLEPVFEDHPAVPADT